MELHIQLQVPAVRRKHRSRDKLPYFLDRRRNMNKEHLKKLANTMRSLNSKIDKMDDAMDSDAYSVYLGDELRDLKYLFVEMAGHDPYDNEDAYAILSDFVEDEEFPFDELMHIFENFTEIDIDEEMKQGN